MEFCTESKKDFDGKRAIDGVSFDLSCGIYSLLGPNRAGKTALAKILFDILDSTEGEVLLDDVNFKELGAAYRDRLEYMPQEIGVYKNFPQENS